METMTIVSLAGIGAIAYAFKIYIIDVDKEIERNREERKNIIIDPKTKKRNVPDFYGVNKLRDDPEGFGKNLLKNQEKLERGEEVAVDAATALYLMRNSKHHDLIVNFTPMFPAVSLLCFHSFHKHVSTYFTQCFHLEKRCETKMRFSLTV